MKSAIFVSMFLLFVSAASHAQTTTNQAGTGAPDKTWVLKDYPNATNIKWHKEKNGQLEFEFYQEGKEMKVWYSESGQVLKTKVDAEKNEGKKGHREEEEEEDEKQEHRG